MIKADLHEVLHIRYEINAFKIGEPPWGLASRGALPHLGFAPRGAVSRRGEALGAILMLMRVFWVLRIVDQVDVEASLIGRSFGYLVLCGHVPRFWQSSNFSINY